MLDIKGTILHEHNGHSEDVSLILVSDDISGKRQYCVDIYGDIFQRLGYINTIVDTNYNGIFQGQRLVELSLQDKEFIDYVAQKYKSKED